MYDGVFFPHIISHLQAPFLYPQSHLTLETVLQCAMYSIFVCLCLCLSISIVNVTSCMNSSEKGIVSEQENLR